MATGVLAPGPIKRETLTVLHECKQIASLGCTVERIRQCCELIRDHREELQNASTTDADPLEAVQLSLLLRECVFGVIVYN
jgi:hypothetical protein